jgi:hypothetical protein
VPQLARRYRFAQATVPCRRRPHRSCRKSRKHAFPLVSGPMIFLEHHTTASPSDHRTDPAERPPAVEMRDSKRAQETVFKAMELSRRAPECIRHRQVLLRH